MRGADPAPSGAQLENSSSHCGFRGSDVEGHERGRTVHAHVRRPDCRAEGELKDEEVPNPSNFDSFIVSCLP